MTSGPFEALDDAVHQLADAAVVFVEDGVALGLAHLLHDHLLGGLRGDAPQHGGRLGNQQFAADFELRIRPRRASASVISFLGSATSSTTARTEYTST